MSADEIFALLILSFNICCGIIQCILFILILIMINREVVTNVRGLLF